MTTKKAIALLLCFVITAISFSGCVFRLNSSPAGASVVPESKKEEKSRVPESPGDSYSPKNYAYWSYTDGYYYNKLDQNKRAAYVQMREAILRFDSEVTISDIDKDAVSEIFQAVCCDDPSIYAVENKLSWTSFFNKKTITLSYAYSKEECEEIDLQIEKRVEEILSGVTVGMSDFEKELYIHDAILEGCVYKDSQTRHPYTVYGSLVKGEAVCEGIARAMKLLLDRVGIKNSLALGTARNTSGEIENHMWNIVLIDGSYYHLDPTWNAPTTDGESFVRHSYFNLTDEAISADHFECNINDIKCNASSQNYFIKKGLLIEELNEEINENILSSIIESNAYKKDNLELQFSSKNSYDEAYVYLIDNGGIYDYIRTANENLSEPYREDRIMVSPDEERLTLQIYFIR